MTRARSTIVAAAVLLIGAAAQAMPKDAAPDQPGAAISSTAAAVSSSSSAVPSPHGWFLAEKPKYESGVWQCSPGLVWRNAGPRDWLCVDPDEAERIDRENEKAAENWMDGPDGAHSCRSGLVRRDAFTRDAVCVDPERRDAVRQMNLALYLVR